MFTKPILKDLRATMLKEMAEVAEKYGYVADFGNIRFSPDEFGVKMSVKSKNSTPKTVMVTPTPNIDTDGIAIKVGTMIKHPARKQPLKVIEITSRGSLRVQASGGGVYRLSLEEAKKYAIAS